MAKKKEIKIVRGIESNYTFLDTMSVTNKESEDNNANKNNSNVEKDILKTRSIDSKKAKIRYKIGYRVDKYNKVIPRFMNSLGCIIIV